MLKTKAHTFSVSWFPIFLYVLLLNLFVPAQYSVNFNLLCTVSYLVLIYIYCKKLHKKNYFDFDTLFFIAFFFVSFFYPTFIYPINPAISWMFQYAIDPAVISRATALSLLGVTTYMWGSLRYKPHKDKHTTIPYKPLRTTGLFITSVFSFLMYIALGGYAALKNTYENGERESGGLYAYFSIIVYVCIFCMIAVWFMNSYQKSKSRIQLSCFPWVQVTYILTYMAFLILAGSRGKVLNIILLSVGLYAYLYKPISFRKVIILCFIGMIAMFAILVYRSGGGASAGSLAELAMDLIITNHNTFEALTIVQDHGLSFGRSMLGYTLGVVPFLQNIVFSITGIDPDTATSAMIITEATLGTTDGAGTGTTLIADIYLAFGTVGVVLFMGFLGWFIRKLQNVGRGNIYYLLVYGILMGMSVYIARAEFFYPLKTILWSCLLVYLVKHIRINHLIHHKVCVQQGFSKEMQ